MKPAPWAGSAACVGHFDVMFDRERRLEATALCDRCPVAAVCLDRAMAEESGLPAHLRFGVRGGLSPVDRRRMEIGSLERTLERYGTCPCGAPLVRPLRTPGPRSDRCDPCRRAEKNRKRVARQRSRSAA